MIFVQTSGISTWLPDSLPVELWHENGLWAKWRRILRFCITSQSPSAWCASCGRHLVTRSQLFRGRFFSGSICTFCPRAVWRGSYLCPEYEVVDPTFHFGCNEFANNLVNPNQRSMLQGQKVELALKTLFCRFLPFHGLLFGYLQPIWHQLATICNVDSGPREQLHHSKPCSIEQN